MSNLNKKLGKYFVGKIMDILSVAIYIAILYFVVTGLSAIHPWLGIAGLLIVFIGVWFGSKKIQDMMGKWEVPDMDIAEKKDFLLIDTGFFVLVSAVVAKIFWDYINTYIFIGVLSVLLIVRTIKNGESILKRKP